MKMGGGVTMGAKRSKAPEAARGERVDDVATTPLPPELSALQKGFKGRSLAETERYKEATDSEFWVAICFTSRKQKEEFLEKTGLDACGDKYLDGEDVAHLLGVELEAAGAAAKLGRVDRTLAGLVKR